MSESPEPAGPLPENEQAVKAEPVGYCVSNTKFWIMNLCTIGAYSIYWAYKNFLVLEVAKPKHPRAYAFIHAFFLWLSLYRLIGLLEDKAQAKGSKVKLPKRLLAVLYFFSPFVEIIFFRHQDYNWIDVARVCFDTLILFQIQLQIIRVNREIIPDFKPEKKFGKKETFFCILGILCNLLIAWGAYFPLQENLQYTRWHFVDQSNTDGWKYKTEKRTLIFKFWQRFAEEENRMRILGKGQAAKDYAKSWLADALYEIDPNIDWDLRIDSENPEQNIFVLTSRLHWGNRPLIEEMIKSAPKIEGWKFMSTRPKAPPYLVEMLLLESGNGTLGDFEIECSLSKEHLINVLYKDPSLKESNSEESRKKALEIIDLLIGQDNEDQWIGWLATEKTDHALKKDEACKKFISDFNELKEKLLKERFDKPIAQMSQEDKQNAYDILSDAFSSFPFDSRRFSKFNEKFCHLTVKKENTFKTPEAIENKIAELDKALRAQNCGCALGGSFELEDRFYFDLCVSDIDKAAKVLQEFSRKNGYGKDSWLEFYDDLWISEWIGMHTDSPVPEMRNPDRLPR